MNFCTIYFLLLKIVLKTTMYYFIIPDFYKFFYKLAKLRLHEFKKTLQFICLKHFFNTILVKNFKCCYVIDNMQLLVIKKSFAFLYLL